MEPQISAAVTVHLRLFTAAVFVLDIIFYTFFGFLYVLIL